LRYHELQRTVREAIECARKYRPFIHWEPHAEALLPILPPVQRQQLLDKGIMLARISPDIGWRDFWKSFSKVQDLLSKEDRDRVIKGSIENGNYRIRIDLCSELKDATLFHTIRPFSTDRNRRPHPRPDAACKGARRLGCRHGSS
jgi:hypothetical protein